MRRFIIKAHDKVTCARIQCKAGRASQILMCTRTTRESCENEGSNSVGTGWGLRFCILKQHSWAFLAVQWLRIHLPMQGIWVRSLAQEDPTCRGATKPVSHNYWACAPQLLKPTCLEPVLGNTEANAMRSPRATTRESPCTATKTQSSQK